MLVRRGANVNATWGLVATGDGGWNGLHIAANFGRPDAARILLQAGTDVNRRTLKGETPLDIALRNGEGGVAQLLRAAGGRTAERRVA